MLLNRRAFGAAALTLPIALSMLRSARAQGDAPLLAPTPAATADFATDAYIYAYSLVIMEMTRRNLTNTVKPEGTKAPMGQFASLNAYPDPKFKAVTAPNADTLYSSAWLDLSAEPYLLSLPAADDRYYLMPMLSGWTDIFAVPGKRTTGTGAQTYVITGPNWSGGTPDGIEVLQSPTSLVWILGRIYCTGTPEDYDAALRAGREPRQGPGVVLAAGAEGRLHPDVPLLRPGQSDPEWYLEPSRGHRGRLKPFPGPPPRPRGGGVPGLPMTTSRLPPLPQREMLCAGNRGLPFDGSARIGETTCN